MACFVFSLFSLRFPVFAWPFRALVLRFINKHECAHVCINATFFTTVNTKMSLLIFVIRVTAFSNQLGRMGGRPQRSRLIQACIQSTLLSLDRIVSWCRIIALAEEKNMQRF